MLYVSRKKKSGVGRKTWCWFGILLVFLFGVGFCKFRPLRSKHIGFIVKITISRECVSFGGFNFIWLKKPVLFEISWAKSVSGTSGVTNPYFCWPQGEKTHVESAGFGSDEMIFFGAREWWGDLISSGQIIATSHDLGPQKVAFWKGNPLISGKSRVGEISKKLAR